MTTLARLTGKETATDDKSTAIRPFRADRTARRPRRPAAPGGRPRWPDKETVADESQGAPLAKLQELVRYWAHGLRLAQRRGEAERLARSS